MRRSCWPTPTTCCCVPGPSGYTRAYLHHLVKCSEPLGPRLLTIHNLHHDLTLMQEARDAIDAGVSAAFARRRLAEIDRHAHGARAAAVCG